MTEKLSEKVKKFLVVKKKVKLEEISSYKTQILIIGSTISFLLGGFDLLLPFLLAWFSYFIFESYAWEFGLDNLGVELITLACVLVGMKFEPAFSFIYAYVTIGTMSSIAKFVDPDSDEISNPFGSYAFGYGVAALSASYLAGNLPFPELLVASAILANLARFAFDLLVYRSIDDIIWRVGNIFFNCIIAMFFSFLSMVI